MVKRKHPEDRAARLKINEEKKARKSSTVKTVPEGSSSTVHSSDE